MRGNSLRAIPLFFKNRFIRPFRSLYFPLISSVAPEKEAETFYSTLITKDDVVVEVGARLGAGTMVLSRLAKHVYSFEPNKDSFRVLKHYTKQCKNVDIYNLAVGEKDSSAWLNKITKYDFSASASLTELADYEYGEKQMVKMIPLDSFAFPEPPTCLLLDCEGYESHVLDGASKMIQKVTKVLVETHILKDGSNTSIEVKRKLSGYFESTSETNLEGVNWIIFTKTAN